MDLEPTAHVGRCTYSDQGQLSLCATSTYSLSKWPQNNVMGYVNAAHYNRDQLFQVVVCVAQSLCPDRRPTVSCAYQSAC